MNALEQNLESRAPTAFNPGEDPGEITMRLANAVLALVNALYMKASWLGTFDETATKDQSFTGLDGSKRTVSMMNGGSDSSAAGNGWMGATKTYVGGLSAQFILPDEG